MSLQVIILAAGQGTRMKSALPKVLHPLAGKPLLEHVINTARHLQPECLHIVYGHGGDSVKSQFAADDIQWVHQEQQLGTGHAVQLALENIASDDRVCIQYGDVPMLSVETLTSLLKVSDTLGVLTAHVENPAGYGRIIRGESGQIEAIVEDRDTNEQQKCIQEINTGIMAGNAGQIEKLLGEVGSNNDQGEVYLTDIIALANKDGIAINTFTTSSEVEITGINDKVQLASMERSKQQQIAEGLMKSGVTLYDPARLDVRGELICGKDIVIDINCLVEGKVELQDGVCIGPNVCLKDCIIGPETIIKANCVIEGGVVGKGAIIGPFARIRPGTQLNNSVHIGNFVEVKNSEIDEGSKVNHLSYIGDSQIGKRVNVGAGTITCNYDGAAKHQTTIKDDVFIGSGSELVAPIIIGKGATVGAGSTISKDIDEDVLVVERTKARTITDWQRPKKK
jgi:bifunctional UDP-N-acetylglucosamine pyrophosphorylase/glucosamine-1-phosphate N-acetyltransferase